MTRRTLSLSAVVLAAILFFSLNILSQTTLTGARLDLTENRLFTLSEGTRNILKGLKEPITLRLFYSESLANTVPDLRNYANRVREMLREYVNLAGGKIRLEVIDPEPFSAAEDRAVEFGLQGAPIGAGGDTFYLGLAGTNTTDDQQVIPFFQKEKGQFLEYDLTKLIYGLGNPKRPVVGVISSLPLEFGPGGMMAAMRGQSRPYGILQAMRQFFEVRMLAENPDAIDDDIDVVVLIHARNLSERAQYAIDQFVLGGGRAMIFVDPFSETGAQLPPQAGMPPNPTDSHASNLQRLFKAWGVNMAPSDIVGDRVYATRVNAGGQQIVDYVSWLSLRGPAFNREDVVTGQLNTMLMASAVHLTPTEGATTEFEPLLTSSPDSMIFDRAKIRYRADPSALLAEFKADSDSYVLAARVTGPVKSAFERPPAAAKDDGAETGDKAAPAEAATHLSQSREPINVIVVADVDLLDDRFWLRTQNLFGQPVLIPTTANADFLVNGLDNLAGSNDLIGMRSRARADRPFERVAGIRRGAEQKFLARERALRQKLDEAERQIAELQSKSDAANTAILSQEERQAIDNFRDQMLNTRRQLRAVQLDLRRDIDGLETTLKIINIGLVPVLIFVIALVVAAVRYRTRKATARRRQA